MNAVVLDASVLLKWVLHENEPHIDQALALRQRVGLREVRAVVPPLWYFEVGNTLARRVPALAAEALAALRDMQLEEHMPGALTEALTVQLVREHGVTFYDASYHALAIVLGGTFVTSDARYIERAQAAGHIAHLMDWPLPGG
jgi:predicted nucleic acid-binding protein